MALDGAAARRRGGPRRLDPQPAGGVGGVGPPRELHRPARRLQECKERFRLDKLDDPNTCPSCGKHGTFTEARQFNLMFKTHAGPVEGAGHEVYLRPETAQGMFLNFKNVLETSRKKPPFGIAQVGKSFRNEITPGNFVFRTREFEQMEMEYFVPPDESQRWYEYWCQQRHAWYIEHGISSDLLRLRPHDADELSHYSSGTSDVEFLFPWGFDELEGIANRGDYDLTQHAKHSGERLEYFDQTTNEHYVPHVIEPAAGATRTMMAFLMAGYARGGGERRDAHRAPPPPPDRAVPGGRAAALQEGHAHARSPARCSSSSPRTSCATTTRRRPSAAATGARTRSAPPSASPSTSNPWTTAPSLSVTATRWTRSGCRSTICSATSGVGWTDRKLGLAERWADRPDLKVVVALESRNP